MSTQSSRLSRLLLLPLLACSPSSNVPAATAGPTADLEASAKTLFAQYDAAVKTGQRDAIARFYHVDGAVRVINGTTSRMSRAQLDSVYRGPWTPPAFFAFEALAYDSLDPASVLVTGGFRWARPGASDTANYLYAAVLQAIDSGLAIRFEHETLRPPR